MEAKVFGLAIPKCPQMGLGPNRNNHVFQPVLFRFAAGKIRAQTYFTAGDKGYLRKSLKRLVKISELGFRNPADCDCKSSQTPGCITIPFCRVKLEIQEASQTVPASSGDSSEVR